MNNFKVGKIYVGDIVYDEYARFSYNFISNFISFNLIKLIIRTIFKVLSIEYFTKNGIKLYCHLIVASICLAIRFSTHNKIKTLMIGNYLRIFKDYEDFFFGYYLISKERLNKLKKMKKGNLASKYFEMRLSGKSFE